LDEERSLYKKADTRDELLARILDAAFRVQKREQQLRRKSRDLGTRVSEFIEVDGGIFEYLLCNVTNISFLCNTFVI